jgi:hypothetical protein
MKKITSGMVNKCHHSEYGCILFRFQHQVSSVCTVKKVIRFPVPSWDVTYQTLPDIPAGDGKTANLF